MICAITIHQHSLLAEYYHYYNGLFQIYLKSARVINRKVCRHTYIHTSNKQGQKKCRHDFFHIWNAPIGTTTTTTETILLPLPLQLLVLLRYKLTTKDTDTKYIHLPLLMRLTCKVFWIFQSYILLVVVVMVFHRSLLVITFIAVIANGCQHVAAG